MCLVCCFKTPRSWGALKTVLQSSFMLDHKGGGDGCHLLAKIPQCMKRKVGSLVVAGRVKSAETWWETQICLGVALSLLLLSSPNMPCFAPLKPFLARLARSPLVCPRDVSPLSAPICRLSVDCGSDL